MSLSRIAYRLGQFRRHLGSGVAEAELSNALRVLSPAQMKLFTQMSPGEQAHSLDALRRLEAAGERHPDLLTAALLHDVGKVRRPLHLWERVWIVLAGKIFHAEAPSQALETLPWWQKPLAVAAQHPAWGAEMAQAAGCSPRAVALIRRHQEKKIELCETVENIPHPCPSPAGRGVQSSKERLNSQAEEDALLRKLQAVDEES